jgi:poly(3-hydroxybutyrate) depolymerase
MKNLLLLALIFIPITSFSQLLTSNTAITITKTWSQEPNGYTYPMNIFVPPGPVPQGGFPVCILLHGNGSMNPNPAGPGMINQFGSTLQCHILVAPTGYQNTWNICAENSDAPDVEMIKDLVNTLQGYTNVDTTRIRILGTSNGSGLANRIFIENDNAGIDIICAVVSHLNEPQYHQGNFHQPGTATDPNSSNCGYNNVASPLFSRKYLSISNTNDNLIPYNGGTSLVGVSFLPAETAAFTIAEFKGYTGSILTAGTTMGSPVITEYSYLAGDVVHIKGDAQHGLNDTQKDYIKDYFSDCSSSVGLEDNELPKVDLYPNPAQNGLNVRVNSLLIGANYTLCDELGRTILTGNVAAENTFLDVSNLTKGIYFLSIGEGVNHVLKVVKE